MKEVTLIEYENNVKRRHIRNTGNDSNQFSDIYLDVTN